MTRALTWLSLVALLGACASVSEDGAADLSANSCSDDLDCGDDGRCRDGMCVAAAIDPFNVYLQVTPAQLPDGSDGRAVWLTPLRVDGPIGPEASIAVPEPTEVSVDVLMGGVALDAFVRFVEVPAAAGLPIRELETHHGEEAATVVLPLGARYEVVVEPTDTRWPPLRQMIEVASGLTVEFDYDDAAISTRTFALAGLPPGLPVQVRAVDSRTGDVVSSQHSEALVAATVTLTFAPGAYPYTLEVAPMPEPDAAQTGCNRSPVYTPSYRISLGQEGADPEYEPTTPLQDEGLATRAPRFADDGTTEAIELPAVQSLITYRGTVQLCEGADVDLRIVGAIPITLRSTHLLQPEATAEDGAPAMIAADATFEASTTAERDEDAMTLQFCAEVFPGDYEIVVTAPGNIDCGIFAEERLLKAPPGGNEKAGDSLVLASTASIEGNLSSAITEPVADATVDASPLAREDGINLAEEDRGVTQYNRPRQTTTDDEGDFSLSLDVGAYDVTVKPPVASGLSWLIVHDVLIADRSATFSSELTATIPVPIEGNLEYTSGEGSASLAGAQLRAFTLVGEGDGMRTIEIGQATADEDGHFSLLAPPTTWSGLWGDGTQ